MQLSSKISIKSNVKKKVKIDDKTKIYILSMIAVVFIMLFIFSGLNARNYAYNLSKRIPKIIAICVTGGAIAFSSIIFQTITNNRILTPSILGLNIYIWPDFMCLFIWNRKYYDD